ncbi:MAG: cellulase family glycosylhydrolase [Bacteroides sp.]|nr:cellulase family glycosylhydrolase [Bacteroides sp.]MCM1413383.1 cellulase family glycosylhydrolase [Bacteroides sp.]MCM1471931.1 cellulase family glycosylhydrolase [Bacteroides sp.]
MMHRPLLLLICVLAAVAAEAQFVRVGDDGQFWVGDSVYRFIGTNYWYGPILASDTPAGNYARLTADLDSLQALGVNNLRVLCGAEGPANRPHHVVPVLQTSPGEYDERMLAGLDRFIAELERRDMKAVLYLTNAWEWSGGYGSYLEWAGYGTAPVPGIDGYKQYVDFVSDFVLSDSACNMALDHARFMTSRVNSVTGKTYSESPAIMSWQICNEPRAFSDKGKEALFGWLQRMAEVIHQNDPNHLVSTGSEGMYGCEIDLDLWQRIHTMPEIDYANIHLWPTNWGWASRDSVERHVDDACRLSGEYIDVHLDALQYVGKPLVIEEFGYPRDGFRYAPDAKTEARDKYYSYLIDRLIADPRIAGINFWGYNGIGRSADNPDNLWHEGDDYLCDPAHEPQGMYGVFDSDRSTLQLIRLGNQKL